MARWWPWLRLYTSVVDNPKLRGLPEHLQARWFLLVAIAARHGGQLPSIGDVAFSLRLSADETRATLAALREARLFDQVGDAWTPHDYEEWQQKSDLSTDRVRKHRAKRNETVSETADVNVSETFRGEKKREEKKREDSHKSDRFAAARELLEGKKE